MQYIQRQRISGRGRLLAEWLNSPQGRASRVGLNIALSVSLDGLERDLLAAGEHVDRALDSKWVEVKMRGRFVPRGQGIEFELEPHGEEGRWLYAWGVLHNAGHASRLRSCPRCGKFWYCDGRSDKRTCSKACKDALWEKTPEGRKAKREYMRRLRATQKKLWERKQRGWKITQGRKLHVTLKKGE